MTEPQHAHRWPPPRGTSLELPVPTKTAGLFVVFTDTDIVLRILSVAADVSQSEIPETWQRFMSPGTAAWYQSPTSLTLGDRFTLRSAWQKAPSALGPPEAWLTHWQKCGSLVAETAGEWEDEASSWPSVYTPSKVRSQRAATTERVSPISLDFGISFEHFDASPRSVDWYRKDRTLVTPFVDHQGPFISRPGDYVFHILMPRGRVERWQRRRTALSR